MGNVTISLEEKDEARLRALAGRKYGSRKGSLAKVVAEGLEKLHSESERERSMRRQLSWMEKGFRMGKIKAKKRADIYDRA